MNPLISCASIASLQFIRGADPHRRHGGGGLALDRGHAESGSTYGDATAAPPERGFRAGLENGGPEEGQDSVPGQIFHVAADALDLGDHVPDGLTNQELDLLFVEELGELGRASEVCEQDRDGPVFFTYPVPPR